MVNYKSLELYCWMIEQNNGVDHEPTDLLSHKYGSRLSRCVHVYMRALSDSFAEISSRAWDDKMAKT